MIIRGREATHIGTVLGVQFYEDPYHGGDAGIISVYGDRKAQTDWYDLPRAEDIEDPAEFMDLYS